MELEMDGMHRRRQGVALGSNSPPQESKIGKAPKPKRIKKRLCDHKTRFLGYYCVQNAFAVGAPIEPR